MAIVAIAAAVYKSKRRVLIVVRERRRGRNNQLCHFLDFAVNSPSFSQTLQSLTLQICTIFLNCVAPCVEADFNLAVEVHLCRRRKGEYIVAEARVVIVSFFPLTDWEKVTNLLFTWTNPNMAERSRAENAKRSFTAKIKIRIIRWRMKYKINFQQFLSCVSSH